jgi:hypothetical protein
MGPRQYASHATDRRADDRLARRRRYAFGCFFGFAAYLGFSGVVDLGGAVALVPVFKVGWRRLLCE